MIKVRRPARTLLQLLNAREKVFRPQGFFLSGRGPVASLSPLRRRKAAGFCISETRAFLCVISVALCASVINVLRLDFTTETQRSTEDSQRVTLRSISASWLS